MKKNSINLFWQFWNQWLKYRNVDPIVGFARLLVTLGVSLMAPGGVWWIMAGLEVKHEKIPVSITLSIGPETVTYTGLILLAIGLGVGFWGLRRVRKTRSSCLVYLRGMPGMHDQPPVEDLPPKYRFGEVTHLSFDSLNQKPAETLQDIEMLKKMLDDKIVSMNIEAPVVVFAGLAPVPILYSFGIRFSNRSSLRVMDYNRFEQKWHMLDDLDDGGNIEIAYPQSEINSEIAVAIPFTLSITESQIPEQLRDKTIWVRLSNTKPETDVLSSEEKLKRILREFHDMIRNLRGRKGYEGVEIIHLFVAAQASTVFKLGTEYQANIYPEIRIYHFNGGEGKYTWSMSVRNNQFRIT